MGIEIHDSLCEDELEVHVPEAVLVELLDGGLQPPVRAHEGDGDGYLGVHGAQRPVLQGDSMNLLPYCHIS